MQNGNITATKKKNTVFTCGTVLRQNMKPNWFHCEKAPRRGASLLDSPSSVSPALTTDPLGSQTPDTPRAAPSPAIRTPISWPPPPPFSLTITTASSAPRPFSVKAPRPIFKTFFFRPNPARLLAHSAPLMCLSIAASGVEPEDHMHVFSGVTTTDYTTRMACLCIELSVYR